MSILEGLRRGRCDGGHRMGGARKAGREGGGGERLIMLDLQRAEAVWYPLNKCGSGPASFPSRAEAPKNSGFNVRAKARTLQAT